MKRSAVLMMLVTLVLGFMGTAGHGVASADNIIDVHSVDSFKQALEGNTNAHIRLQADIVFARETATDDDTGVLVGAGSYVIDLNSHRIEYNCTGRIGDPAGDALVTSETRSLVINGPGSIVGGVHPIRHDSRGVLTINGASLRGVIGSGLCLRQGAAIINSGTITGNFYGVFHEGGIMVVNGGTVKSIVHRNMGHTPESIGVIRNGVFTGDANIDGFVLVLDDLTIASGSSMRVYRHGGLVVNNSVTNNGKFIFEGGLRSVGGDALITSEAQIVIDQDLVLDSLKVEDKAHLRITNGATITVNGSFVNDGGGVFGDGGFLNLMGSVEHRGHAEGIPQLKGLQNQPQPQQEHNPSDWAIPEVEAARNSWLQDSRLNSFFQNYIRREEFCELVVRLYESLLGQAAGMPDNSPFIDADHDHVLKANRLGIVNGKGEGKFDPDGLITRQEMATMYARLLNTVGLNPAVTTEYAAFADEDDISQHAKAPIQLMFKLGIFKGKGGNVIAPLEYSTREQAIALSNRIYDYVKVSGGSIAPKTQ